MSSETTTSDSVLDLSAAMINMDGDVELLQEIMEIFLETAVATEAHGMKGGASNFCASKFVDSALALEKLAKGGSLEGAAGLLDQMRADYAEVKEVALVINWDEVARNWGD